MKISRFHRFLTVGLFLFCFYFLQMKITKIANFGRRIVNLITIHTSVDSVCWLARALSTSGTPHTGLRSQLADDHSRNTAGTVPGKVGKIFIRSCIRLSDPGTEYVDLSQYENALGYGKVPSL